MTVSCQFLILSESFGRVLNSYLKLHGITQLSHDCHAHFISYLDKTDLTDTHSSFELGSNFTDSFCVESSKCKYSLDPILNKPRQAEKTTSTLPFFINN